MHNDTDIYSTSYDDWTAVEDSSQCDFKGSVHENERGYRLNAIKKRFPSHNLTSVCCVYKEKIVKDVSYRITYRPYKFRKFQHTA